LMLDDNTPLSEFLIGNFENELFLYKEKLSRINYKLHQLILFYVNKDFFFCLKFSSKEIKNSMKKILQFFEKYFFECLFGFVTASKKFFSRFSSLSF